jgi:uncharacterized membrane protein HdeD (DUF308 family)
MLAALARRWWVLALRGLLAVLFGIAAFVWPRITATALILVFGAYALIDGAFTVLAGFGERREHSGWWLVVLQGLVAIIAGVLALSWPNVTAYVLALLVGVWALITGVFLIIIAIRLRKELENEWSLLVAGLVSIALGIALVIAPVSGVVAMTWLIASYAIILGVLLIALALRLRRMLIVLP